MEMINKSQVVDMLKKDIEDFEEALEFFEKRKQYKECLTIESKLSLLNSLVSRIENMDECSTPIPDFKGE